MKNMLKKTAMVVGGMVIAGIAYQQHKKNSVDIWLKDLIIETWESTEVQTHVKALDLVEKPTLSFETLENNSAMCVRHTDRINLFTVVSSTTDYIIHVDVKAVYREIDALQKATFNYSKEMMKSVIKMLLLHECRHLHQIENGFFIGESAFRLNVGSYGLRKEELDANKYALSCANSCEEEALFELLKTAQESVGDVFGSNSTLRANARKVRNLYHPIHKLFNN